MSRFAISSIDVDAGAVVETLLQRIEHDVLALLEVVGGLRRLALLADHLAQEGFGSEPLNGAAAVPMPDCGENVSDALVELVVDEIRPRRIAGRR